MKNLKKQIATGLANLILSGLCLTPVLALVKAVAPLPIPWLAVFIPWIGTFHLALCWCAARIIAKMFWDLARLLT